MIGQIISAVQSAAKNQNVIVIVATPEALLPSGDAESVKVIEAVTNDFKESVIEAASHTPVVEKQASVKPSKKHGRADWVDEMISARWAAADRDNPMMTIREFINAVIEGAARSGIKLPRRFGGKATAQNLRYGAEDFMRFAGLEPGTVAAHKVSVFSSTKVYTRNALIMAFVAMTERRGSYVALDNALKAVNGK